MENLIKPVMGMIGLLSKVMLCWSPDGKQSKLIHSGIARRSKSISAVPHLRLAVRV